MFYTKIKIKQNDSIIVFIKNNLSLDFNEYGNEIANIINLKIDDKSFNVSINMLCIYRSPSLDSNEFFIYLNEIMT